MLENGQGMKLIKDYEVSLKNKVIEVSVLHAVLLLCVKLTIVQHLKLSNRLIQNSIKRKNRLKLKTS